MTTARIVSRTPGRVRLRIPPEHRHPEHLERIQAELEQRPGVEAVRANPRTGSVLVTGADDDAIIDDLDEIGNVLSLGMGGSEVEGLATRLGSTIARLNQRLYAATGENYHLGTVLPGSMAVVGFWQTLRNGLGLELVPGPLMLWLAWDVYRAHGRPPDAGAGDAD
ncbi:MAG: HMA2 domain-containing protein [Actinomycetota bacterium]